MVLGHESFGLPVKKTPLCGSTLFEAGSGLGCDLATTRRLASSVGPDCRHAPLVHAHYGVVDGTMAGQSAADQGGHHNPGRRGFAQQAHHLHLLLGPVIVFVSQDRTEAEMQDDYNAHHGGWLRVPYGDNLQGTLKARYKVAGIPTLVVLKGDGALICANGRADVQTKGCQAFKDWLTSI
ncbi:uncharacterized protein LOC144134816 isoform X1 [Amblyomma americanum]